MIVKSLQCYFAHQYYLYFLIIQQIFIFIFPLTYSMKIGTFLHKTTADYYFTSHSRIVCGNLAKRNRSSYSYHRLDIIKVIRGGIAKKIRYQYAMCQEKLDRKVAWTVLRGCGDGDGSVVRMRAFIDVLFTRIRPTERGCACSSSSSSTGRREAQVPRGILRDIPKELYSLYRRKIHGAPSYEPGRCKRRERRLAYEGNRIPRFPSGDDVSRCRAEMRAEIQDHHHTACNATPFVENIAAKILFGMAQATGICIPRTRRRCRIRLRDNLFPSSVHAREETCREPIHKPPVRSSANLIIRL